MACNALSANYNIELASTLKFTEFSQTLIECGNLLDRSRETAYNAAMREVTSYHIESSNAYTALIMFNAEGAEVLRYSDTYTVRKTYFPFINKSR